MANSSYDMEVKSILAFLHMQRPAVDQVDSSNIEVHPDDLVTPRFMKRHKTKQVITKNIYKECRLRGWIVVTNDTWCPVCNR